MNNSTELIVRALIIKNRRILVCQTIGREYFFLPGGHVEFLENMQKALRRELYEEMGAIIIASQFIGVVENLFQQENHPKHEVSFVFHVDIDLDEIVSREAHMSFYWFSMKEFLDKNIVPPAMKNAILKWAADKEPFFIEEGRNK